MQRSHFRNQDAGVSLIYVMMIMVISVIAVTGIAQYLEIRAKEQRVRQVVQQRAHLFRQVFTQASLPSAILLSAHKGGHNNVGLSRCIGTASGVCSTTVNWQPLDLLAAKGSKQSVLIAGVNPVRYNFSGSRFNGQSACTATTCPFQVQAFFRANCLNNALICNVAQSIDIRIVVGVSSTFQPTGPFSGIRLSAYPASAPTAQVFASERYTARSYVSDIMARDQQCPPFSYLDSVVNELGETRIRCRCLPGAEQFDALGMQQIDPISGHPICAHTPCGPTQVFLGFENGRPRCYDAIPENFLQCDSYLVDRFDVINCGPNSRLRGMSSPASCWRLDDDQLACEPVVVTCCRRI